MNADLQTRTPAPSQGGPLLRIRDLRIHVERDGRPVAVVDGLSYQVLPGQTLAIVGESGSGKSMSCRALIGLLPSTATAAGSIQLNGKELLGLAEREIRRHRGNDIAMVFQNSDHALNPTMRVGRQITEAARVHDRIDRRTARRRAVELLRMLKLAAPERYFHFYPHQLSGGMRQRVMIAIALAGRPKLLIADEPTRSLDATTQAEIMALLAQLQRQFGMALILVSHDLALVASVADEVLVIYAGRSVEHARTQELFERTNVPYTQALLDAIPSSERPPNAPRPPGTRGNSAAFVNALLSVRGITHQYAVRGGRAVSGSVVHAVSDVSFDLKVGETLGVVGESGSGKSTLARALLQMPRPRSGSVFFDGRDLTRLSGRKLLGCRRRMQMVFQDPLGSLDPTWRVSAIVAEPLICYNVGSRAERCRRVSELMDLVGMPAHAFGRRRRGELSGGQCQRVAIARALALEPALLICDEAISSLDVLIQSQILDLFRNLRAELGLSYLFISHDLARVKQISERVSVMHLGQLCEIGPTEEVYSKPFHPYTAALLAPSPTLVRPTDSAAVAEPPSSLQPPSGCRYRTRCLAARDLCAQERPQLRAVGDDHLVACHFPIR